MTGVRYLTTLPLDDDWLAELARHCGGLSVERLVVDDADEIPDSVWEGVEILQTGSVFPTPERAPRLRWIQLDTSGVEHVVGHPIWQPHVAVTTLGGIAPVPMAEFTTYCLLGLAHHRPLLDDLRRRREWPSAGRRLEVLTPLPVDGAVATIVGYGRIGREVARALQHLGMHVIGVSRRGGGPVDRGQRYDTGRGPLSERAVEHVPATRLPDVLPRTDYLIVVAPRTPETVGMIGRDEFDLLKEGACLVNVSRGGVVDEESTLAALRSRRLRYAAVDVFETEPLTADSVWWDEPYASISPHVAGLTSRYREQVLDLVTSNVQRYLSGNPLLNRADHAAGY